MRKVFIFRDIVNLWCNCLGCFHWQIFAAGNVQGKIHDDIITWKLFSALLNFCASNSSVAGEVQQRIHVLMDKATIVL